MKTPVKNLFIRLGLASTRSRILSALIAGLGLLPAGRATAQNFQAWPVTQIAAGLGHTLFIKSDGSLWGMGDNGLGKLGLGPTVAKVNVPQQIVSNSVLLVAAGYQHSLYKTSDGTLWGMGDNGFGQLGLGTSVASATVPQQILSGGVGNIAAGWNHSLYTGGHPPQLWVMGDNSSGQLGDGTYDNHYVPESVFAAEGTRGGFVAIAGGGAHSLFVTTSTSGEILHGMGENANGQLGAYGQLGNVASTNEPVEIWPVAPVPTVAAGLFYSLFIDMYGDLLCMGDNEYGQLGWPDEPYEYQDVDPAWASVGPYAGFPNTAVVAAVAGAYHSLFILSDGSLWDMGDDAVGQLGISFFWGYYTDAPQEIEASNVVAVAAGNDFSLYLKSDGSLWGMGDNSSGQLGTGDYTERDTPVEIVAPPPPVTIIPYGANVILAWPTNAAAFVQQSTTNLAAPALSTVSPGPIIIGNRCQVFTPGSGTQQFYRLMLNQ